MFEQILYSIEVIWKKKKKSFKMIHDQIYIKNIFSMQDYSLSFTPACVSNLS